MKAQKTKKKTLKYSVADVWIFYKKNISEKMKGILVFEEMMSEFFEYLLIWE
jgi:hypothetical protein